ncbi:MAG: PAC2 family protein [Actinomycetia bacterium]|nr:PAC2 family protein [Actinomycetes bacterium]MCP5030881.1 PAC2 family protein [Actinomycetes bacterium]
MDYIEWTAERPQLRDPILIAAFEGWGDAGDAATTAARHIRDRLSGESFASIDPEPYYDFTAARPLVQLVKGGRKIEWPSNEIAGVSVPTANHDLLVIVGVEPQLQWRSYTRQILSLVDEFDVKLVISLGALIADVVHSRPATVYTSGYDRELNERLDLEPSTYEGPTGIVGVLHDALQTHGTGSVSLWGTIPGYVPNATSPKAALALVERVSQLLELTIPTTALEIGAAAYERQISELVEDNDETQAYVAQLEENYDSMRPESGAALIEELEEYLRDR